MGKNKIKITLDEYDTTCGDGCCTNYGTNKSYKEHKD